MTTRDKELTLAVWMEALNAFKIRLRKCLRIVIAAGVPREIIIQAARDILDGL